ncbi:MAG: DNA ligase-associated DEXH box helicase, partial [Taibaiella sp.]|nr:DNA ligase-associated DEXH box helicase [Taibaiella sp.]
SAQVRLEYKGEICVISGDYKTEYDGISTAFEPVKCHSFVTESTFGLPIYTWKKQEEVFDNIRNWVAANLAQNKTSVLIAYSLGKAQRLIKNLTGGQPIYVHQSIANLNEVIRNHHIDLPETTTITPDLTKDILQKGVLIVPPVMRDSKWIKTLINPVIGVCSGWMQVRAHKRWESIDAGFPLSDHADWPGLLDAISATGAEKIFVTHGFTAAFSRYLNEAGLEAKEVMTKFGANDDETTAATPKEDDTQNQQP